MREYVTEAIVLEKEPAGETDAFLSLFTEKLGRISARATSARKITSKLAAHLEPMVRAAVRLVEKRPTRNGWTGFQVADALRAERLRLDPRALRLLGVCVPEGEPNFALWELFRRGVPTTRAILAALGFDPRHAACAACGVPHPDRFFLVRAEYFCAECSRKAAPGEAYGGFVEVQ